MRVVSEEFGDPSYRLGVGMIVVNKSNKIFVGQRIDSKLPAWQMPQGGIGPHESIDQAMLRELEEEIGTRNVEILVKSKSWYKYDLPLELSEKLWSGKYKGQQQIWFLLRFRGQDDEINIHTYHPEFNDWKWVEKDELLSMAVSFKKSHYERILNDLWKFV